MIGTRVLHYDISEKLGEGGMGEVYLAQDTRLNRSVAIKFLPPQLAGDDEYKERFRHEAETAAALSHPNIITVHDVGELEGRPFIVLERLQGQTLQDRIAQGDLEIDESLEITRQILEGLATAHRAGIVHRDIKPANIFITQDGMAKILDFGLAKSYRSSLKTKAGTAVGTVQYESPEQSRGKAVDQRSDLFSVGAVLYHAVSGRIPFGGEFDEAVRYAISHEHQEPLARFKSGVSPELERFVNKLLEKDVALRYQDAQGALSDLRGLLRPARQASVPRRMGHLHRARLSGAVAAAALAVVAGVVTYLLTRPRPAIEDTGIMLAVLPFQNLGPPEDDYFADGMTEEITSRLARIPALGVISRTSAVAASLRSATLHGIGEKLKVQYVLEGTIRWSRLGDTTRVRITPQLVRVADDRHVWANNYERRLLEVFAVQADIAGRIVAELGLTLTDPADATAEQRPTNNEEAYKLYLRALHLVRRTQPDPFDFTAELALDSAVALDPQFALAHALLSEAYAGKGFAAPHSEYGRRSLAAAKRSLELQPGLPQGRLALGRFYNEVETDYDKALEEFLAVRSTFPNDPDLLTGIAYVRMRQGLFEESCADYKRAAELDPLNPERHHRLAECYKVMRRYDDAFAAVNRAIEQQPTSWRFHTKKIIITAQGSGDVEKLRTVILEGMKACGTRPIASQTWQFSSCLPELNWDSLALSYADSNAAAYSDSATRFDKGYFQFSGLGDSLRLRAYADSLRPYYEERYRDDPESPFANSNLGLLLARLGDCDRAIELGARGRDFLSMDKCHY